MATFRKALCFNSLVFLGLAWLSLGSRPAALGQSVDPVEVDGQPLAANVSRLLEALDYLGRSLPAEASAAVRTAADARYARKLQQLLDVHTGFVVTINPESHVKVNRGPAKISLQQGGFTPVLVKVLNVGAVAKPLRISSPQAGFPYAGTSKLSMTRQDQLHLLDNPNDKAGKDRFLHLEIFGRQPMTEALSGLKVEYAVALIYSAAAGRRDATIGFHIDGKPEMRGEAPVQFENRSAVPVRLAVKDVDGRPTTGRFTFRDAAGHVYPPQPGRLAPDLFFQQQVYRRDGDTILLPPGTFTMYYSRGPEYRLLSRKVTVPAEGQAEIAVKLERWIDTAAYGFYSGDHHIHAAGCAHYTSPTEGVFERDMFRQVQGEGLNVGCILTWGPCFDFQQQFFSPTIDKLSEPLTVIKYDIEVSGFGSQALGHVCLLNLREQHYPGSEGTKRWPTWTTPVLRWAKEQGAVTGYAHSASGLQIDPPTVTKRMLSLLDADKDGRLSREESMCALLPEDFAVADADKDGALSEKELFRSIDRQADRLPNLVIPELNSVGAQEIFVTTAQRLCDFISAMDTARLPEWNCWYHIMNCGFPLKVSGETDFPCMSSTRVGQGRVYVQLGKVDRVDFPAWCSGLAKGRSYVSDGYAHTLEFKVNGKTSGDELALDKPRTVQLEAKVAFATEVPPGQSHGVAPPDERARYIGDNVVLHGPRYPDIARRRVGNRLVEVVVNGKVVASQEVPADEKIHSLSIPVKIDRSSWVALRHFPQLHTNPVAVLVGGKPIRASRQSALWCIGCIEQLWRVRGKTIGEAERAEAQKTFERAKETYRRIAAEAPEGS